MRKRLGGLLDAESNVIDADIVGERPFSGQWVVKEPRHFLYLNKNIQCFSCHTWSSGKVYYDLRTSTKDKWGLQRMKLSAIS